MASETGSRPESHHISIAKTARYWTLGDADGAEEVWFVLHGYKQLARRFLRRFEALDSGGRLIVAPEALSRFYIGQETGRHGPTSAVGATWMTREDRVAEIEDYVAYLDRVAEVVRGAGPSRRVTILGFSQGVATAARWVTLGSVRPDRLVLWGEVTPPDLALDRAAQRLADVDVVLVRGDRDLALAPELVEEEAARLAGAGITCRTVTYGGGHDIHDETLRSLV